jgi:ABC-type branched-subunit amino acid transport system ATPase component/branched-subunit amino acid ABC-type transport system permease component
VQEILRFAMLGLGLGALYSLASQGLMVIYRGSGVLNFAHGAIGMVGAYIHWEVKIQHGNPAWVAWIAAVTGCAIIGALAHLLVMRQLKRAAPLARIVATLGLLVILQSAAVIRYGARGEPVKSELPRDIVHPFGGGAVSIDRFLLLGIATAMSVLLWALYRYTKFGLATTAVAENQRAASSLGLSPDFIASANWALGSALAGMAAILISPLIQLQVSVLTNVVLAAMAAALVASFRSFPIALLAGVAIGIGQSELTRYVSNPGWATSLPFLVIIGWMVLRGQALPLRDFFLQRLPAVGSGKVHPGTLAGAFVLTSILILSVPAKWQDGFVVTFSMGLVLLSVVVVTGYAGQLSLAQFALAGFGALIAGRLVDAAGWPFPAALLAAVVATVPLGALFALPAVRARGINLAIVTLGLGTALEFLVFNNARLVGGFRGTVVGKPNLFGWEFNAIVFPGRYAIVSMGFFTLVALMVASVRRGRSGRRLLAVRTNERAAAALGISVIEAKVYAFALSAGIAAIGGTLMAFRKDVIIYKSEFLSFNSILVVAWSFIGGIGYLFGPLTGATLASGALGAQISNALFSGITKWIQLIGGVILVLLVILNQDGLAREQIKQIQFFGAKVRRFIPRLPKAKPDSFVLPASTPPEKREKIQPKTLEVRGLTVKYGAVIAVDDLSLTVQPGQIVGLIGPNGAGKTSAIDAITGFTKMAAGRVHLEGVDLSRTSPIKRSRAGLSRSFQTLELFEDASVLDNLRAASDPRDRWSYLTDLVNPKAPPLPDPVVDAIHEFQLEDDLLRIVQDLPYGQRRLLAIARAVATEPGVLLLDEPAAGLGDHETAELAHLVRRLADDWGIAVLLVEHDMNFVMSTCDHIVVLDFGRQISEGSPEEVRSDPKVIAAYLGEHEKDDDDHDDDHDDESELRSIAGGQE